jgi:mRNA-degrading endonuclease RelE of RelBE toxin-antitoxin system
MIWDHALATFSHYRLTGTDRFRLRVGDYRIIYAIDVPRNEVHLLAVGHRRDIFEEVDVAVATKG